MQLLRNGHAPGASEVAPRAARRDNRMFYAETVAEQESASRLLSDGAEGRL